MGEGRGGNGPPDWWPTDADGALRLGVGPGAWVVRGGLGAQRADAVDRRLLRRLAAGSSRLPRDPAEVEVVGPGQLTATLRAALGADAATAVGEGRETSEAGGLGSGPAHGPRGSRRAPSPVQPAVVTVHDHLVPVGSARRPSLAGRPVLPVVAQTARVVIGPWTGLPAGPCLHCLDLHRRDRDPTWPSTAASLEDPLTAPLPPALSREVVAAVTALTVLLTARVPRVGTGTAHEVGPWPPYLVTRRWTLHPECPWHTAAGSR